MSEQPPSEAYRPRTRLDPEERKQQIIQAAIRAFAGKDPAEVGFDAVAEVAGVSRSLVYSYFSERAELFAAAYTHALDQLDRAIDKASRGVEPDRERLRTSMRAYLDYARRHPEEWNVIAAAGGSRQPAVRAAVMKRHDYVARRIRAGPDAGPLVSGVIGMLEAAAEQMVESDDSDPNELAELLAQVIWSGVNSLQDDSLRARLLAFRVQRDGGED